MYFLKVLRSSDLHGYISGARARGKCSPLPPATAVLLTVNVAGRPVQLQGVSAAVWVQGGGREQSTLTTERLQMELPVVLSAQEWTHRLHALRAHRRTQDPVDQSFPGRFVSETTCC